MDYTSLNLGNNEIGGYTGPTIGGYSNGYQGNSGVMNAAPNYLGPVQGVPNQAMPNQLMPTYPGMGVDFGPPTNGGSVINGNPNQFGGVNPFETMRLNNWTANDVGADPLKAWKVFFG